MVLGNQVKKIYKGEDHVNHIKCCWRGEQYEDWELDLAFSAETILVDW